MADIFLFSLRAVLPILLTVALGYGYRLLCPDQTGFFAALNSLCFHVFLPVNLFVSTYNIGSLGEVNWLLVLFIAAGVFFALGLGVLCSRDYAAAPEKRCVLVQGTFRSNQAVLGMPLAMSIGGEAAAGFAALTSAVCVPLFNILSVVTLSYYNKREKRIRPVVMSCLRNPLIVGVLCGVAALLLRALAVSWLGSCPVTLRGTLPSLYKTLSNLAQVASPLMLFVLGARLNFGVLARDLRAVLRGVLLRLVAVPVLALACAYLLRGALHIQPFEAAPLISVFASPCAVSMPVMVQEMGGDADLAGQIVVWSTVLSLPTIFLLTSALRALAFI